MVYWLWNERGVLIDRSTVSRILKRNKWSKKELQRLSRGRSESLRQDYRDDMLCFMADDILFLDESIFNEKTSWRFQAYAPIGDEAWYTSDVRRGRTWSICMVMTLNNWLSYTGIREGYFNADEFFEWLTSQLLPAMHQHYPGRTMVVIMDNNSIHIEERIIQAIQAEGYLV